MPSRVNIQPPRTAPTRPRITFAIQPKPRPRDTLPASHPATRPMSSHAIRDRGPTMKKKFMRCSFLGWLLLRHTVYRTEAENEVQTRDSDDGSGGEQAGECCEGDSIVWVIEGWNQDDPVADVEVGVARGEALPVEKHGFWHRQGFNVQRLAILILHLAQQE